jgi:predicted esterase YcpF (UPF0227 family)
VIIYIHGFGSSGLGGKASLFRDYFRTKNIPYIAPSLSYVPALAMATLEELIGSYDEVSLIGSSLGGYYAIYLAEKYGLKVTLINPAVMSAKTLAHAASKEGLSLNYYDLSKFEWCKSHLGMLRKYKIKETASINCLLLLQKDDDVLDYKEALEKFPQAILVLEEGGSHSFENIESHFDRIEKFLL